MSVWVVKINDGVNFCESVNSLLGEKLLVR